MKFSRNADENRRLIIRADQGTNRLQPIRKPGGSLRGCEEDLAGNDVRATHAGLDPKQAIFEWIEFAQTAGYLRVSGDRSFDTDLIRVYTMEEEARSLFEFARARKLGFPESTLEIARNSPTKKGGAEHQVFFDIKSRLGRVVKVTFAGKYGRKEHTPFLYLERCQLLNEMVPAVDIRFEDCLRTEKDEFSIVTSMQYFAGEHPSSAEADHFVKSLGFTPLKDRSETLDYISLESRLIIRDCHPLNWIKTDGALIPIDIVPERIWG